MKNWVYCKVLILFIFLISSSFVRKDTYPQALYMEMVLLTSDSTQKCVGLVLMDSILYQSSSSMTNKFMAKHFRCYEKTYETSWSYYQGINGEDLKLIGKYFDKSKAPKAQKNGLKTFKVCDLYGNLNYRVVGEKSIGKIAVKFLKIKGLSASTRKIFENWKEFEQCMKKEKRN